MFDKVVVLSDGYPIYSGHAGRVMEYFGSIGYEVGFNFINPADVLLDLANGMKFLLSLLALPFFFLVSSTNYQNVVTMHFFYI